MISINKNIQSEILMNIMEEIVPEESLFRKIDKYKDINIIEDSKKSAAEASARNIVSAAKTKYMQDIMDNKKNTSIDLSADTLKYDGDKATKGILTYNEDGNVTGKMYISGYCVEVKSDESITSEKIDEENC